VRESLIAALSSENTPALAVAGVHRRCGTGAWAI